MADRGIPGHYFHVMDCPLGWPADEGTLYPTMLVAKGNLQMQHLLSVALETEVARFNNTRVDWPDGNLMHLFSFDTEEIGDTREDPFVLIVRPDLAVGAIGGMEADGLEPGVPCRLYSPLFGDLPLKPVRLRAVRSKSRIVSSNVSRGKAERAGVIMCHHCQQAHRPPLARSSEERGQATTLFNASDNRVPELGNAEMRDVVQRGSFPMTKREHGRDRHTSHLSAWAASWIVWRSAGGRYNPSTRTRAPSAAAGTTLNTGSSVGTKCWPPCVGTPCVILSTTVVMP